MTIFIWSINEAIVKVSFKPVTAPLLVGFPVESAQQLGFFHMAQAKDSRGVWKLSQTPGLTGKTHAELAKLCLLCFILGKNTNTTLVYHYGKRWWKKNGCHRGGSFSLTCNLCVNCWVRVLTSVLLSTTHKETTVYVPCNKIHMITKYRTKPNTAEYRPDVLSFSFICLNIQIQMIFAGKYTNRIANC